MPLCSNCYYYHFPLLHQCSKGLEAVDRIHKGNDIIEIPLGFPEGNNCNQFDHIEEHGIADGLQVEVLKSNSIINRLSTMPINLEQESLWPYGYTRGQVYW